MENTIYRLLNHSQTIKKYEVKPQAHDPSFLFLISCYKFVEENNCCLFKNIYDVRKSRLCTRVPKRDFN